MLRSASFWLLWTAYALATATGIAVTVLAVPLLVERGHGAGFAALRRGVIGVSQIPGGLPSARWPRADAGLAECRGVPRGRRRHRRRAAAAGSRAVVAGLVLLAWATG